MPNISPNQMQGIPAPAMDQSGMTGQSMMQGRLAYLQYMQEAQTQGRQPVSLEQFLQGAR